MFGVRSQMEGRNQWQALISSIPGRRSDEPTLWGADKRSNTCRSCTKGNLCSVVSLLWQVAIPREAWRGRKNVLSDKKRSWIR
jgi:hypothetical protein